MADVMTYNWTYLITVIAIAVVPEVLAFLWFSSSLSTRVKIIEKNIDILFKETDTINTIQTDIAVIKSNIGEIRDDLKGR